jgi:hypothetical protein
VGADTLVDGRTEVFICTGVPWHGRVEMRDHIDGSRVV